ncbi:Endonuclease/Exonuclease/phosphatase family [Streptococcus pneumoniae]|uniref:endonuclease/exonuclease/phosphatase family protein n=1 Tax=Streptococcus pneumoniae TaxID=1313 RepID=UPI0005E659B4|nr:endonuclease/exonuclease/phosphatase family protein [Streptococcus pneumoniae]CIV12156.1 Endonuclease/Exonuclease/phosphatase family [Streptococcus pneumoniae]CKD25748.1 Endonuclease/Exonuclease/phosphatase family [Streptococcus pneumoniae]CKD91537.1 Endonuclease/Exonuclease/phosphatase family [Streptococcus pneumoniae]HEW8601456.1 endonuclease/exonuclease/phosphatase family protein [Streptococcus pneumoniae]
MKILNININDFGGPENHREDFKNKFGNGKYIQEWDKLDKKETINSFISKIDEYKPDIIIIQEYDINSTECQDIFVPLMRKKGYIPKSVSVKSKKRPSMTVFFVKNDLGYKPISTGHDRNGRAYAIQVNDLVIYGTHVPPSRDVVSFWKEINNFVQRFKNNKLLLIGDFNTVNFKNNKALDNLLENPIHKIWSHEGCNIPGDYVLANFDINQDGIDYFATKTITDHEFGVIITTD